MQEFHKQGPPTPGTALCSACPGLGSVISMAAGKPWWQTTKTVRGGLAMAAAWAVAGVLVLVAHLWAAATIFLVTALTYLSTAAALWLRERAARRPS